MSSDLTALLLRLVTAVERLAPPVLPAVDLDAADAFVWEAHAHELRPVATVAHVPLPLLVGIDRVRDILLDNTRRFAAGRPANNALLWGARGMGKSSLIKAIHRQIDAERPGLYFVPEAAHPLWMSLNAPLPLRLAALKPAFPLITVLAFATLPRWARRLYGLPATPLEDLWATVTLRALHTGTQVIPAGLRYSPDARRARRLMTAA